MEIRSWSTEYRGLLWVHTGSKSIAELERQLGMPNLFTGGFIGSVMLDAVIPLDRHRWVTLASRHLCALHDYKPGLYGWVLSSPNRFVQPIPGRGQLNLFYPGDDLTHLLKGARADDHK
jgi:hypothetical protein